MKSIGSLGTALRRGLVWMLAGLPLFAMAAGAAPAVDFRGESASPQARAMARTAFEHGDARGLPFAVVDKKEARRLAAEAREKGAALRKRSKEAEADLARLTGLRSAIDHAMFAPSEADAALAGLTMTELMKRRADVESRIEAAEQAWLAANEQLESVEG